MYIISNTQDIILTPENFRVIVWIPIRIHSNVCRDTRSTCVAACHSRSRRRRILYGGKIAVNVFINGK